ncbi:shikimate dehydrogenase [Streptomyces sp. NPDC048182]|uniref:shikimate dehydrogenase n=1 Tax=Streptomyces sp. NPDC048182 TaxID=3365507 RepID=UPI003721A1D7
MQKSTAPPAVRHLAVLGAPVASALSPVLHRAAYAELGLPWTYRAVECDAAGLPGFLAALDDSWAGLSLTMPLKRAVVPLLDEVSAAVTTTGCANTVVVRDGRLIGDNTDVHGMVTALRSAGVCGAGDVTVLGAGATAGTALAAVRELGADRVRAVVRDPRRAGPLAATARRLGLRLETVPWSRLERWLSAELVVSTVPRGALDAEVRWPAGPGLLLDVTYRPWPHPAARAAERAGRTVESGLSMLVHQAARQLVLQTGVRHPPVEVMARAAREAVARDGDGDRETGREPSGGGAGGAGSGRLLVRRPAAGLVDLPVDGAGGRRGPSYGGRREFEA